MTSAQHHNTSAADQPTELEIAIVGMAGRFPGAADTETFWRNLRDGVESVRTYTDEELLARGVPAELVADPDYVKTAVTFEGADLFDAAFFGYTPREAERLDPQHRVFLECAWEALENAGYDTQQWPGTVAVFAGAGANVYLLRHLLPRIKLDAGSGIAELLDLVSGNGVETLCTRVAYKLGLRGPAATVQTACSTSLMAVHLACQSLLANESDMALAGGVTLNLMQSSGYRYQAGAIFSPDGHCRAFDAQAGGTMLGSGAGVVVLKRLEDALHDGDHIHAVIRATAANNDAADKIGFTAPSVNGQAAVIRAAQVLAGVTADSIGYVEAHGTGTTLGDPIEVAALTQAFRIGTNRKGFCALGSVKTNVGHLDCAAGVAGLIKAALALKHRTLPASLHFEQPNPRIDFAGSPFFVNAQTRAWDSAGAPRRAGVSGFGIGGTNVHAVLEEAPAATPTVAVHGAWQVLPVSAASAQALQQAVERLGAHLEVHPEHALADIAYTLQVGRRALPFRAAVAVKEHAGAVQALARPGLVCSKASPDTVPEVVFLFPGAGSQHACMGAALYEVYPVFRAEVDRCLGILLDACDIDLRPHIFPETEGEEAASKALARMEFGQAALFVISYATARLWMSLGVKPTAMLGHSLGEYVAACVAGVFSLEDALRVVVERARLQQTQAPGAMTSVLLSEADLQPFLGNGCELSVANGEQMNVLSGPVDRIEAVEQELTEQGHVPRRLHVTIAAHSAMTEPIMAALEAVVSDVPRQAPRIPFVSNVTGLFITAEQAMDPAYWVKHLRSTVRFGEGLNTLLAVPGRVVLEVGSSDALTSVARQHALAAAAAGVVPSQAHARQHGQNIQQFVQAVGHLWSAGVAIDWSEFGGRQSRRRVPLPTYPFQHRKYWIEPGPTTGTASLPERIGRSVSESLYVPLWKRLAPWAANSAGAPGIGTDGVLVLGDSGEFGERLSESLRALGCRVAFAEQGSIFEKLKPARYAVPFADREAFVQLLRVAEGDIGPIGAVMHSWTVDANGEPTRDSDELDRGFFSLLALTQAMGAVYDGSGDRRFALSVITSQLEDVLGDEALQPIRATLRGLAKVIGQEYPYIAARVVDVQLPIPASQVEAELCAHLLAELKESQDLPLVAYRRGQRWIKTYEALVASGGCVPRLRKEGVYVITGGLGGVGLALAKHLAQHWKAKLVLIGRTALPSRAAWERLATDDQQPAALRYRLQQLLDLERLGASVLAEHADVSDAACLRSVVDSAHRTFGPIHGVIHAAGDPGSGMLSSRTRGVVEGVFASKIRGTQILLDAVAGEPLDFIVLCSSISAVAGGLGMGDYAAANAYLDALAVAMRRTTAFPVLSVNWDAWRELGMAAGMKVPDGVGWSAEEGAKAFEYIVCGVDQPHLVVCTTNLVTRLGRLEDGVLQAIEASAATVSAAFHPRPELQTEYVLPEGEREVQLAALWSELLGVSPVGANDSLFELGGDSLLAIQLMSRIRAVTGIQIHVSELFRHPTPRGFAAILNGRQQSDVAGMDFAAAKAQQSEQVPLSYAQQRLWFLWKLSPEGTAYNVARAFRITGSFDPQAAADAIRQLVARHAALRTVFREDGGVAQQVILQSIETDVPILEMPAGDGSDAAQLREYVASRLRIPFDLENGPLLRAEVIRVGQDDFVMLMVMHHVATDGWSVAVMMNEFAELYAAGCGRRCSNLRPLEFSYADFATAQRRWLEAGEMMRQTSYWRKQLAGVDALKLPPDRKAPDNRRHPVGIVDFRIGSDRCDGLRAFTKAVSVTPYVVLLASTALVLAERSGQRNFYVGSDMANRNKVETESMVGFFVNQVPLRIDVEVPGSVGQLLEQVQGTVVAAADFQDLPFDRLVEALSKGKRAGRAPLFQVKVIYQEDRGAAFSLPGLRVEEFPVDQFEAELDLIVSFLATDRDIRVEMTYDRDLFQADTMESIRQEFLWALDDVLAGTEKSIHSLSESISERRRSERARKAADRADRMSEMRSGLRRRSN